jgi:23S rRNA (cytosine1962-C5)-methyltransferase
MELLTPGSFPDYELLDSGGFEKLERFGPYVTIRPEPQAVWAKELDDKEWRRRAHVRFVPRTPSSGEWEKFRDMPDRWNIAFPLADRKLVFRLALTRFKHVGLFPEQAVNWEYIFKEVKKLRNPAPRVLNLFAYTGAASLAARAAGADVTHLDAVRQVVSWARENMEQSGLDGIRWLVEDALVYVRRERKRGKRYGGIILDPPAWGHGPDGERWKLEDHILEMVSETTQLLDPEGHFFLLNTYSLGFSPLVLYNLVRPTGVRENFQYGELYLASSTGQKLPLGVFARRSQEGRLQGG